MTQDAAEGTLQGSDPPMSSHDLTASSNTILACETLALLGTHTLLACLESRPKRKAHFPSSITTQYLAQPSTETHPTTTAQCIGALQTLVPKVRRFQFGNKEGAALPFHTEEAAQLAIDTEKIYTDMFEVIDEATHALSGGESLVSSFGFQHPFTCSHALRAVTPRYFGAHPIWWEALWVNLFYMNTLEYGGRARTNPALGSCPPSAFLASKCLDALESVVSLVKRRRDRFETIIAGIKEIIRFEEDRDEMGKAFKNCVSPSLLSSISFHETGPFVEELIGLIKECEWDSAIPSIFKAWQKALSRRSRRFSSSEILAALVTALAKPSVAKRRKEFFSGTNAFDRLGKRVQMLRTLERLSRSGRRRKMPKDGDLPNWIYNKHIRAGTESAYRDDVSKSYFQDYWYERSNAGRRAELGARQFKSYLVAIERAYSAVSGLATSDNLSSKRNRILKSLEKVCGELKLFEEGLARHITPAISFTEVALHEQLSYERSSQDLKVDLVELAHALRVACRYGDAVDIRTIKLTLETICQWQLDDGTWPAQRSFLWTTQGFMAPMHSIEIARAMLSIMITVSQSPERFGIGRADIATVLAAPSAALRRYFIWLNSSAVRIRQPRSLAEAWPQDRRETKCPTFAVGWCLDSGLHPGTIHPWLTANVLEFLSDYRDFLQDRVNNIIRSRFLSYHHLALHKLEKVSPTDLKKDFDKRTISKVRKAIGDHRHLHRLEKCLYFHSPIPPTEPSVWSMILYGPPGTSKSYLAKAIAGELGWPLVSLSPSDFLAGGEGAVETRAREIFSALEHGNHLVYFFDEIDELILDREQQKTQQRSVFTFLTPSFLTKLQDLRDAAAKREFIFIVGTNYLERIDSAAKRTGRIDDKLLILYPDMESRASIIAEKILKLAKKKLGEKPRSSDIKRVISERLSKANVLPRLIEASALLQFLTLGKLAEKVWNDEDIRKKLAADAFEGRAHSQFGIGAGGSFQHEVSLESFIRRPGAEYEFSLLVDLLNERLDAKRDPADWGSYAELVASFETAYQKAEKSEVARTLIDVKKLSGSGERLCRWR